MSRFFMLVSFTLLCSNSSFALTPEEVLAAFKTQASSSADYKEFSIARGETFFKTKNGDMSCTSCHTENPAAPGQNSDTGKDILPLAPAANPDRFTDMAKVEKWFKRNCNDVLERECTAQEKGDVLTYLISVKDE